MGIQEMRLTYIHIYICVSMYIHTRVQMYILVLRSRRQGVRTMGRLWLNVWHTDEKNVAGRQTFPDCSSGLEGLVSVGQWCECSYWEWRNVGEVDDAVAKSGTG